jgi:hypothetical protein
MENSHMDNISKVLVKSVHLGGGIVLEGHQYPSGEFGLSITSASTSLGFSREWLGRAIDRSGNTFKALCSAGFSGISEKVATPSNGGEQVSRSILLKDFNRLILYAASKGNPEAVALADALLSMSLTDLFRDTFGERPLTLDEKRAAFYRSYAATINWLEEDRQEWRVIEEQEAFILSMS